MLNFIPSTYLAKIPKPKVDQNHLGAVWSRYHDCELLLKVYEHGCEKISPIQQLRLQKVMNLVRLTKIKQQVTSFDFGQKVKETSGFSLEQKLVLYEILTTYGIPCLPENEQKEDWRLLMLLLQDRCGADFSPDITSDENLKNLERFVNQMDVVSTKIVREYNGPVNEILN